MMKNVAGQVAGAQLNSKTDGSEVTSGTTTVYVTLDNGSQATGTVGSGAATHKGHGYWTYAPSQAETNGNLCAFTFVNTSAITNTTEYDTTPYNQAQLLAATLATNFADPETGITYPQAMKLILAGDGGEVHIAGGVVSIKAAGNPLVNRIVGTTDGTGQRVSVTLTP